MTTPPNKYPGNRSECRRPNDKSEVTKNRDTRIEELIPTRKHRTIPRPLSHADTGNHRENDRYRKRDPRAPPGDEAERQTATEQKHRDN